MKRSLLRLALSSVAAAVLATAASADSGTKVALVPGGPHPYFSAWEQAGKDAVKDFGLGAADYRVPQKWELATQSQLLESLLSQGYNAFLIFPGDAVGTTPVVQEITPFVQRTYNTGVPLVDLSKANQLAAELEDEELIEKMRAIERQHPGRHAAS